MDFAQRLIHHPPEHLREPEVEAGEAAEENRAEKRIVEVGDHEICIMDVNVHRRRAVEDAGEPAEDKDAQSAQCKKHGRAKRDRGAPQSGENWEKKKREKDGEKDNFYYL